LVERSEGKEFFIAPGGSVEEGENPIQALIRELKEEFNIEVSEDDLEEFGTFTAPAAGQEHRTVVMEVFMVKNWSGDIVPSSEVEEILWITSDIPKGIKVGSIFEHNVIPKLKQLNLID